MAGRTFRIAGSTAGVGWAIRQHGICRRATDQRDRAIRTARRDSFERARLIVASALSQVGLGLVLGIPAANGSGRALLAGQLYGVKASDPLVLGGGAILLAACATAAAFIPGLRASGINPASALRVDR